MTLPKVSQFASLVLSEASPQPANISQMPILALSGPPDTPSNITQLPLLALISDARSIVNLENPIPLNCWQPCTQYGTYSIIIYLGD